MFALGPQDAASAPAQLYTWSRCKRPLPLALMRKAGIPLPGEMLETIAKGMAWQDFEWGPTSLRLRGKEYKVLRLSFLPISKPVPDST